MQTPSLNRILVIDEIPLISLGLQEALRPVNPSIIVEYTESIFTALSSASYADKDYDLVIIGSRTGNNTANLRPSLHDMKERFGKARIMIYSLNYDHDIIQKMEEWGIDAYVHKYEDVPEIRNAYIRLASGQRFISAIFHTLYFEYCLDLEKIPGREASSEK